MLPVITMLNITNQGLTLLGITIFDITNPSHVFYCFVDFYGMECQRAVPLMTPLSARTYLEAYYVLTDPENSEDLLPLVESFRDWDLIPASVLEDAWPGEGWEEAKADVKEEEGSELAPKLTKLEIAPRATLVTLRDRTMDTMLQKLLESPEGNLSLVAEAEDLTDFLPRLKDKFYDAATTMKWSSYHLDLLYEALQNEYEVDLSLLSNIPVKELAILVAKLYENGKMGVLNLSHRPDISMEDLRSMIGTGARLRVLCLLEMPQIRVESLGQYLVNCEVHHSDLLAWWRYPAFDGQNYGKRVPNIEFPATGVVSQVVWTGLGSNGSIDRLNYLPNGRIAWENLRFKPTTDQWLNAYQKGLEYRLYDLCMPVAPCKLVPGVLRLLKWAGSVFLSTLTELPQGMAYSLATSLPCAHGTGHGISFLNPSLYRDRIFERVPAEESCVFSLKAGEWALFLVSEAYDARDGSQLNSMLDFRGISANSGAPVNVDSAKELSNKNGETESGSFAQAPEADPAASKDQGSKFCPRKATSYALITRVADSGPSQYMVADIPTYLGKVLGDTPEAQELIDAWTSGIASIENAEFFGDDTYKILQKLSPKGSTLEGKEAQGAKQETEHAGTGDTGGHRPEVD